ncbi:MAG: Glycerophosphoryl diester phosphodiesterase [uncultured Frankineae bacterium]|uniref:Glycerophosphoryl diester phosphodiesterase n=1 Tax=uncultured Frankineae bacterium TaxID=437475 RepID=A0A6J4LC03_9ACTN|nr:MAG: Glycerophosphoryl diester phosphodiesterase [uncultured Frankineae bacterium]
MPAPAPLVVAHRGSSAAHAEHTLAAYELALQEGADSLECDVRLTRDGVLVCVHDRRIDRVSDGQGVLSTLELADLADLDFASWKARQDDPVLQEAWAEVEMDAERRSVLTLERLVQLALDSTTPAGRPVQLHIETKHPTRYGGLVERELIALLTRYGLASPAGRAASRVTVMSYALTSLRRVHSLAPVLPTVLLMDRVPVRYRDGRLPLQVSAAGVALRVVKKHPGFVQRVHEQGRPLAVFTVDERDDVELVAALGVDIVISNLPGRVKQLLAART